ncbi:two-component system sensor histidine kinase YesM [Paenibacillus cellulosilyticus]|uniref:histidine kinase n=1 Tax=Paenibacillus cellulosilyticus TaxID=375489 RepID=A0A2V2YYA4_9BACL|nr:sensor histidine kinase [Paenibacillus cellulosilyticus]PWW07238.1 two-component system sensor histidine kinase YesM [Paenibacillus cellulosilyticus]QKS44571.1 sensor histidine kinase [Paenibacillus cellulosilyticus]
MDKPFKKGISFRNKLLVTFLLVSLLPMLAVEMMSYYTSTVAMKTNMNDLINVNLLQTSKNLDTSMQDYEDLLFQVFTDDNVMSLVKEINDPTAESPEFSRRKLINILSRYSYAKEGIRSIAIFTSNNTLITYDRQTGSPYDNMWSSVKDLIHLPIYQKAIDGKGQPVITPPLKIDTINNNEQYGFHLARQLSDLNVASLEPIGVAVITVYESVLAQAINLEEPSTANDSPRLNKRNFLTDKSGIIVSSPDKSQIGLNVNDIVTDSTILNTYYNMSSKLWVNNLVDQNQLFKEMYAMQHLTLYFGLSAAVLTVILITIFSGRLTRSIRRILKAMRTAQHGTLDVQVEGTAHDDLSVIALSFNKMMLKVSELMNESKSAIEKQKEAEIRALEAQINPHFLYNTLDSINWMAIEKEEYQISQMLKELAQILRYSVKDSNKRVTLREELKWMNSYVYLQQHRFRSSFNCEVECPEHLHHCPVHKLTFQPFIENAIIHGFYGVNSGGLLRIVVKELDTKQLMIRIEDNGVGMPEDKRKTLLSEHQSEDEAAGSGLGVRNVADRIRSYYGNRGHLDIQSELGQGTVVTITLPMDTEGEEEDANRRR